MTAAQSSSVMSAPQSSSARTAARSYGLPGWAGSRPRRRGPLRSGFHDTLNYASVNEDWRTEATALRIGRADHVLCVTGSGDRPLNMLALDPARVVAIDRNPAQNRLLALKVAAMRSLEYEDYTAFLGLTHASRRWRAEVWQELQRSLVPDCRTFWHANRGMILAGVIYRGRWERFYRRVAGLVRVLRPRMIPRLFEFDDIEKRRAYVRAHWERPAWKALSIWFAAQSPRAWSLEIRLTTRAHRYGSPKPCTGAYRRAWSATWLGRTSWSAWCSVADCRRETSRPT